MISRTVPRIKRAQKESSIFRVVAPFIYQAIQEHPDLLGLSATRVTLSQDKSLATVHLYIDGGKPAYEKALKALVLYKPALRKAIADSLPGRYTCRLRFVYDEEFARVERLEALIDAAVAKNEDGHADDSEHN
jgi:ribosome-binding factor A